MPRVRNTINFVFAELAAILFVLNQLAFFEARNDIGAETSRFIAKSTVIV
jgi:hypothetical protein